VCAPSITQENIRNVDFQRNPQAPAQSGRCGAHRVERRARHSGGRDREQAGQSGSLAVYNYLLGKYGDINAAAAGEGLQLYGEHTEDAKENPGKHPNIDRLLLLVLTGSFFTGRIIKRPG
jgi:hypothetical protein